MDEASTPARAYDLRAKTRDVVAYQYDASAPGRPLSLLLGGAFLAGVCLLLICLLIYRAWYLHEVSTDWAWAGVSLLFAIYSFGVFLFCYGYELYDTGKALRLTIIVAVASVIAIFAMIAVLSYAAKLKSLPFGGGAATMEAAEEGMPYVGSVASMFEGGGRTRPAPRPVGASDFGLDWYHNQDAQSPPFLVRCDGCGSEFMPSPPSGLCPTCGRPALSAG